jgi:PAS domain-containing protein
VLDGRGKITEVLVTFVDISERKRAEDELRRLTIFQQTILNSVAYSIVSTTPDGIVTGFNPAAERLLGYQAGEVVGLETSARWHDPEEVARRAQQLSRELGVTIRPGFGVFVARACRGLPDEGEWICIRKDGARVPVLLSVTALRDERGQITGFVGLIYDMTERKRAEEALRRLNQELERRVADRTAELQTTNQELQRANKLFVGRELRMAELKEKLRGLEKEAGNTENDLTKGKK